MPKNKPRRRSNAWAKAGGWSKKATPPVPAPPDGDRDVGTSGNRKGNRVSKGDVTCGSWIPVLRPDDLPTLGSRVAAIREAENAGHRVSEMNHEVLRRVCQLPDDQTTFVLNTDCTVKEYEQFLQELHKHALRVAPFTVPVVIDGVKVQVPVTPMMPDNVEDYTYHTIILRRPSDGAEIHILVEDCSRYIKAIKIVMPREVASTKRWHRLGKDPLHSRYTPCVDTDYGDGYGSLSGVYMNSGIFLVMFEFFLGFDADASQMSTPKGERILYTSYIAFGEAPRFPEAKFWVVRGLLIGLNHRYLLPSGLSTLIHDWGVLSKAIFSLYLALLEERLGNLGKPTPDAHKSMVKARKLWHEAQVANKKFISFFHKKEDAEAADTPIFMNHLCGRQVTILRHDYELWNKVQLRLAEYTGYFLDEVDEAYSARKLM